MRNTIIQAIREKRILAFTYDGHPRVVEPHCYGLTRTGKEAIRCYQTGGTGVRPDATPWHLMTVSKMIGLQILEDSFSTTRPGYKRGDEHMTTIFEQI